MRAKRAPKSPPKQQQKKKNEADDDDDDDDINQYKQSAVRRRSLTRRRCYSGWFHPHKSWKCILFEYIISWFLRLDKLALTCQKIMLETDDDDEAEGEEEAAAAAVKMPTSASSSSTPTRISKQALQLMTLENAKVRHRMEGSRPAMLDKSLKQWLVAAKCPIVDYDLVIPHCPKLLSDWGIIPDQKYESAGLEERIPKQEGILVKVRFPACLLNDDDDDTVAAASNTDKDKNKKTKNSLDQHQDVILRPKTGSLDLALLLQQHVNVPVVLHFHGGGLVLGSANDTEGIDLMRGVCNEMMMESRSTTGGGDGGSSTKQEQNVEAAIILLDIEYSLAPEHAFPTAIVQGLTVLQYLLQDLKCQNRLHITGISAGGLLAAVTTLQGMRRFPNANIASSILLCPMLDPSCQSESYIRNKTSSWLVPTAWLQWCWQVYLCQQPQPPQPANENNNKNNESSKDKKQQEQREILPSLELATAASTDTISSFNDSDYENDNQTNQTTTTTTTRRKEESPCWWQEHKNNSKKLAPLMSPLWDDLQDLFVDQKNKKNLGKESSSWPRFIITTNRGDPLHDEGVALVQKLRAAVVVDGAAASVGGENQQDDDKQQDNNSCCAAASAVVQHLDHDGTHWFGTVLDTPSNQELIHACKDILFPSG